MQSGGPRSDLNEREAFVAMGLYMQEFYRQTHGHFPTLMADIEVEPDGVSHDPAAWDDWVSAVAKTRELRVPAEPEAWAEWAATHHDITRMASASARRGVGARAALGFLLSLVWLPTSVVSIGLLGAWVGPTILSAAGRTHNAFALLGMAAGSFLLVVAWMALCGLLGGLLARKVNISWRGWWASSVLALLIWSAIGMALFQPEFLPSLGPLASRAAAVTEAWVVLFLPWLVGQYLGLRPRRARRPTPEIASLRGLDESNQSRGSHRTSAST